MSEFDEFLKEAEKFHGNICAGIALGTRISLAALHYLGIKPGVRNKNLIVYVEIDRCMTDAVQVVTHCSLGRRSLKHVDYGKFAATFVNTDTGKAVRGTVKEHFSNEDTVEKTLAKLAAIPDSQLVTLEEATVNIPKTDLPGEPILKAVCAVCGERVMDGREVKRGGNTYCRGCADGAYYQKVRK
jgi:formylmethanofuran dehydrogenase subunit E